MLASLAVGATALAAQRAVPPLPAPPLPSATAPLVLRGVTVIDVQTGQRIASQTVVIVESRIRTVIADTAPLPSGARVVNGRGTFLIPGLWDMHTHVSYRGTGIFPAFIANGETGIRDMGPIGGSLENLLLWRQEIAAGTLAGPRMVATGIMIDVGTTKGWTRGVTTPEDARYVVDSLKAAGADFIKIHSQALSREVYFAIAAESRRVGIPFAGHLPDAVTLAEASDSGQRSIEHPIDVQRLCSDRVADAGSRPATKDHETECAALAAKFVQNGTWLTPTVGIVLAYSGDEAGEESKRFVHESYRFGLPMLAGSDVNEIKVERSALANELQLMVEAGLTPLDALRTATLNPAKFFGATDSLGTVAAGKVADLVLLDADPLQDIENTTKIRAVIANGRYYDRAALDGLLAAAKRAAATEPDAAEASP